ncbi:sacsin-like [Mytilus trossulus]|uniref:sacsin-like n=1 Tax=Mytilus trossulus TaxID=6551 RepID=UPI003003D655
MASYSKTKDPIRRCPIKRPPILKHLQNIMREYPEDIQILHELVQNAEDAKATVMKIMYDQRHINPPGAIGQFLKSPALCIYNDGVFDEDDWDGIKSVCLSHKEEKTDKIGRFGQGFKSVFHLADTPVVVSGDTMLIINPLDVDRECGTVFLYEIEHISKTGIFKSFDFDENAIRNNCYPATLFWFPLRSQESELSNNICTDVKMKHLLSLFEEDAAIVLLFMNTSAELKYIILHSYRILSYISKYVLQKIKDLIYNRSGEVWQGVQKLKTKRMKHFPSLLTPKHKYRQLHFLK